MPKQKVLFVFPDLMIGGATSAFLALLKQIDYNKNEVDIQFLNNGTYRLEELPAQVRVLPDAAVTDLLSPKVRLKKILRFGLSPMAITAFWETFRYTGGFPKKEMQMATNQMLARIHGQLSRPLSQEYDLAVAYLELWPTVYVAEKVKAKRKVSWVHVDYKRAGLIPAIDKQFYEKMDWIVGVSQQCADQLASCFPALRERITWAENFVDADRIWNLAKQPQNMEPEFVDAHGLRIVTVARLDSYVKGLDRIVNICARLKVDGIVFRWYIVGGGADEKSLRESIERSGVADRLFLLGSKDNPYPYVAQADLFVLASRNEGKPISVTEAKILNVPIVTTAYPTAEQQLSRDNGVVVENDEGALYQRLHRLLSGQEPLKKTTYRQEEGKGILEMLGIV